MPLELKDLPRNAGPVRWPDVALPQGARALVLAPHPDDFDAIGLTLRHLHERGCQVHVAVLTTGASGVEDGFGGARTALEKAALREDEQRASCRFFGLPESQLRFLRLWGRAGGDADGDDDAVADPRDAERLRELLLELRPQLVFMPHGNDSNRTHRRTYETFRAIAEHECLALHACLNRDAKTIAMRADLILDFDDEAARWKAELLRLHRSQHERNLHTRGIGFDERVLRVNREGATSVGATLPYAEVFELQPFGGR